jgi:hypothetical protein
LQTGAAVCCLSVPDHLHASGRCIHISNCSCVGPLASAQPSSSSHLRTKPAAACSTCF